MKRILVLSGVVLLCACQSNPDDDRPTTLPSLNRPTTQISLHDIKFDLKNPALAQPCTYDWRSIQYKAGKRKSDEYATLVTSTKVEADSIVLRDKITVTAKGVADVPKDFSWIFDRMIVFPADNLFVPRKITIDMCAMGHTVREFSFENGTGNYIDESGQSGTEHEDFSEGILSFDALLRLVPQLPRDVGNEYTFRRYAEAFLFRIHDAEKSDPVFTLRCQSHELVTIRGRPHDCYKFELQLKSAVVKEDLWVDNATNLVVKFVDPPPEEPDADFLEATLRE